MNDRKNEREREREREGRGRYVINTSHSQFDNQIP